MIRYIEKGNALHEAIAAAGHSLAEVDGVWVADDEAAVQAIIDSFDGAAPIRAARKAELNQAYNQAMQRLQAGWPSYEILTWPTQAEEAKRWLAAPADEKPETPFLSGLWNMRQAMGMVEPFEDLIQRVATNDHSYTAYVSALTAIRHAAEHAIDSSEKPEEVTWAFPL